MTETTRLVKKVEANKSIFDSDVFKRLSMEVLGSWDAEFAKLGIEEHATLAQNVHGVLILGYMAGYEAGRKSK